jgi:aminopeptidase N
MASLFAQWRRYEPGRRARMQAELTRIAERPGLSKDVSENVGRMLGQAAS